VTKGKKREGRRGTFLAAKKNGKDPRQHNRRKTRDNQAELSEKDDMLNKGKRLVKNHKPQDRTTDTNHMR